jgi:MFS family permease
MGTAYVSCSATVVRWFVRRRGLAVGIASSGASVGTIACPPLAQALVAAAGWRTAYVVFGVAIFVVLSLAGRLLTRDPESMGLHPDGVTGGAGSSVEREQAFSLGQALRTRAYWMLAATFTAAWFTIFIPAVHLASFVRDLGFPPMTAAAAVSVLGAGALIGRLLMGVTSDSLGRKPVLAIAIALQGLAYLAFVAARSLPALMATAFGFGFAYAGNSVLFPAILGDFFGRRHAGVLVGFTFAITGLFAGLGPLAAGAIHDATGSYRPAFALAAASNLLALVILSLARPPR